MIHPSLVVPDVAQTGQHFAAEETRLIMMSNRIVKEMGFDWFDQLENAPGF